jgi:hypothetical protein
MNERRRGAGKILRPFLLVVSYAHKSYESVEVLGVAPSPACGLLYAHKCYGFIEVLGAPPSPACGGGVRPSALRGGGEKHENKPLVLLVLNAPFLTFPRCAGEGGNGQRRYNGRMLKKSQY